MTTHDTQNAQVCLLTGFGGHARGRRGRKKDEFIDFLKMSEYLVVAAINGRLAFLIPQDIVAPEKRGGSLNYSGIYNMLRL